MSEPFPTLDELRNVQSAVERDRVIRETWEALLAAVEKWETAPAKGVSDIYSQAAAVIHAARACVKARKGNE